MTERVLARSLTPAEIGDLKKALVPACLATLDSNGYPRITPLWFIWEDGAFFMTSTVDKFHIRNLQRSAKASICIQVEEVQSGVHRQNAQIKAVGECELYPDSQGAFTKRITEKYLSGPGSDEEIARRASVPRIVICLRAEKIYGFGGGKSV